MIARALVASPELVGEGRVALACALAAKSARARKRASDFVMLRKTSRFVSRISLVSPARAWSMRCLPRGA